MRERIIFPSNPWTLFNSKFKIWNYSFSSRILAEAGLKSQLHAYGTNIEGEWEAVFEAIRQCHEKIHRMGAPRITTTLKFGTRTDRDQHMADKIRSVNEKPDGAAS